MGKIKLTKNEHKKQKDSLKMYTRYLPTLQLKKQQLQVEIRKVQEKKDQVTEAKDRLNNEFKEWIAVFGEDVGLDETLVRVKYIKTGEGNIAGVSIPIFDGAEFEPVSYDLFQMPLWVDKAVDKLQKIMLFDLECQILEEQVKLLSNELRTTSQRVNLFEKIKIPETKGFLKKIEVYLGDQQTAAVVRGKIAKKKIG